MAERRWHEIISSGSREVFHFQGDSGRSHDMISKHLDLQARRMEALAKAEAEADHLETAFGLYFQATLL